MTRDICSWCHALAAVQAHNRSRPTAGGSTRRPAAIGGKGDEDDDPLPPKLARVVSDVTIEKLSGLLDDNPRGLLLCRAEPAGWLGWFGRYEGKGAAPTSRTG